MSMDHEFVQRWLDAYTHAWETYSPHEIGALFSTDAEYRSYPWEEVDTMAHGREQIVAAWLKDRDRPGTYVGHYHPFLTKGDQAIAIGTSTYYTDASHTTIDREYANLWVLRFAADGTCREFTEWYMRKPEPPTA